MRISLTIAFLLFSSVAFAQSENNSDNSGEKNNVSAYCDGSQNQLELNDCSAEAMQDSLVRLKETYEAAIEKLTGNNQSAKKELFIATHTLWEKYKDMNCEVQAGKRLNSGSIWPYLVNSCNARMNFQRVEEIKATTFLENN